PALPSPAPHCHAGRHRFLGHPGHGPHGPVPRTRAQGFYHDRPRLHGSVGGAEGRKKLRGAPATRPEKARSQPRDQRRPRPHRASNLLVRINPAADREKVVQAIRAQAGGAEVLTPDEFRSRSRSFWLFGTGAGAALFAGALLGVIVGTVIVAQTLYSSTKDHLSEFATLRAMGSSNRYIYNVIIYQALLNAVIGFGSAAAIGALVVQMTAKSAL